MNYFETPIDPEGFGVDLPPRSLRNIDFSALEFDTLMRAMTEYVRTYYKGEFNDFVANNGFIMLMEIVSYVGSVLGQRLDILANEAFLPTSISTAAVVNHLNLIGQSIQRQTSASVQVLCSVGSPVASDIRIPPGFTFNLTGPDDTSLIYELYSAPGDWESDIILPAQKFGVIGWAIEGQFATPVTSILVGGDSQQIVITEQNILDEPILVEIDNELWARVDFLENYGPNDQVYIATLGDDGMVITFGDNIAGKAPVAGQTSIIRYRVGGGSRGRIGTGIINTTANISPEPPTTASVSVSFTNFVPSTGGEDIESNENAKKRTPRTWSTHGNITTGSDYINEASGFNHPIYGTVSKAVATVFTSINANIVKLNILAEGIDGKPAKPSLGLKTALKNHLDKINVLTDDVQVEDGLILAVDVEMVVVLYNNADSGSVKQRVDDAVDEFFNINNWKLGQPLYVSTLYEQIMTINGVKNVNIFQPTDDILPEADVGSSTSGSTIAYNELITMGSKSVRIYYEK
jgi:hypothetical protein